jgi:hypothetical protein
MTCVHLQELFRLCQEHDLKIGGSDLIRVACHQCGEQEVCPSILTDEYDAKRQGDEPGLPVLPESPGSKQV